MTACRMSYWQPSQDEPTSFRRRWRSQTAEPTFVAGVVLVAPADPVALVEGGEVAHRRAQVLERPEDAAGAVVREPAEPVVTDPEPARRAEDRLRVRVPRRRDGGRDHGDGDPGRPGGLDHLRKVVAHALGQDVAAGADGQVDPVEAGLGHGLGERPVIEGLQVLREDGHGDGARGGRRHGLGRTWAEGAGTDGRRRRQEFPTGLHHTPPPSPASRACGTRSGGARWRRGCCSPAPGPRPTPAGSSSRGRCWRGGRRRSSGGPPRRGEGRPARLHAVDEVAREPLRRVLAVPPLPLLLPRLDEGLPVLELSRPRRAHRVALSLATRVPFVPTSSISPPAIGFPPPASYIPKTTREPPAISNVTSIVSGMVRSSSTAYRPPSAEIATGASSPVSQRMTSR